MSLRIIGMLKLKLLTILLISVSTHSYSQDFTLGIKGGVNFSSVGELFSLGESFENGTDEFFSPKKNIGTTFGGYAMFNFGKFLIRPELNYSKFENTYQLPLRNSRWELIRFDLPLLIGYEILEPFSIYIGPIVSSTRDMTLEGNEFQVDIDKRDLSYGVGALIDFGRFGIDIRYEYDPTKEQDNRINLIFTEYGVNIGSLRPYNFSVLTITAHINLFRTDKTKMNSFFGGLFRGNDCYCPY